VGAWSEELDVGVTGLVAEEAVGAAGCAPSKAATTSNVEMKLRVEHETLPPSPVDDEVDAVELLTSGRSELITETRVIPSTSRRAARNLATASCPAAHPWMSSEGPAIPAVTEDPVDPEELKEPEASASTEAEAVRFVSQTSPGMTIATSRSTRSQSKRLVARLVTVS
jgi:hypothetical protein